MSVIFAVCGIVFYSGGPCAQLFSPWNTDCMYSRAQTTGKSAMFPISGGADRAVFPSPRRPEPDSQALCEKKESPHDAEKILEGETVFKVKAGIFLAVIVVFFGSVSRAYATYPVVPEGYGAFVNGSSCPTGSSCAEAYSSGGVSSAPPLFGSTADNAAKSSISLPAAGLPDLAVSAANLSGHYADATAYYWNTITFNYTGPGVAPSTLSSQVSWSVSALLAVPSGAGSTDYNGYASIAISLSTCYCPFQLVSDNITSSGTYVLSNPFTITNGGSIRYETDLSAWASNSSGLTGSVFLDPRVFIDLPSGWTGTLASGGTLGPSGIAETPEPSSLFLVGTAVSLMVGGVFRKRSR
jgi:hypothetical protein